MARKSISVITTSYNSGEYIETAIRSVASQAHNVQYIIIDASSTDGTGKILDKYKKSIDIIVSEPDEGMYHGIQKGAAYVRGEIMSWLNADDAYLPWTFSVVEEIFAKYPEIDWIIGQPSYLNEKGQCIKVSSNAGSSYPRNYIKNGWFRPLLAGYLQQESMFWRKSLWDKAGGLNLGFKLAADFDLWTRFALHADLYSVATPLASFRLRPGEQQSSVMSDRYIEEVELICEKLKPPGKIWDVFSRCGDAPRVFLRMLIWKRGQIVQYSSENSSWVKKNIYRPVSRYSITEALLHL